MQQIQENPYLQFFVGLPGYQSTEPFASSLFVEIPKPMGEAVFEGFHRAIIAAHDGQKPVKPEPATPTDPQGGVKPEVESNEETSMTSSTETQVQANLESTVPAHQGQLILDATVVEQAIRFLTDLSGSVANISLNTIYSGSFNDKTTTDSGFKNICDRTVDTRPCLSATNLGFLIPVTGKVSNNTIQIGQ